MLLLLFCCCVLCVCVCVVVVLGGRGVGVNGRIGFVGAEICICNVSAKDSVIASFTSELNKN